MAYGRKPKLTTEILKKAIHEYASSEPTLLAKKLEVNRTTVWRRMKEIPQQEIDRILREVAEFELKPAERDYNIFLQIKEIREYKEKLFKLDDKYKRRLLHMIHRVCLYLKVHPAKLTLEQASILIRETEIGLKEEKPRTPFESVRELQRGIRSWFSRKGISRELMTAKGIESPEQEQDEERAHVRLTLQQRTRFMEAYKEVLSERFPNVNTDYALFLEWLTLPKYLYYTGTRIGGTLQSRIESLRKNNSKIWYHYVIDKGNIKWRKRIRGELKDLVSRLLELRSHPEEGFLFTVFDTYSNIETRTEKVGSIFKEAYERAGIPKRIWDGMPCHIWRHTACQDLLEATNYNFDLVAEILGWVSVDTMKRHYGKIGDKVIDKALIEAMGEQVEWPKVDFKF